MTPRRAPILAMIPPPAQYALTFLAGLGLDWLMPWRPAWMTIGGVRWAGLALAVAGFVLALAAAGRFVVRRTTLNPAGQPAHLVVSRRACLVAQSDVSGADDHFRGPGARPRRSLAVDLGRTALGRHELGRDPLRGSAPQRNIRPRLRRLLSKGSALDLRPSAPFPASGARKGTPVCAPKRGTWLAVLVRRHGLDQCDRCEQEQYSQTIVEKGNLILQMAQQTRGLGHARAALFRLAKLGKLLQKLANLDRRSAKIAALPSSPLIHICVAAQLDHKRSHFPLLDSRTMRAQCSSSERVVYAGFETRADCRAKEIESVFVASSGEPDASLT